MDKKFVPCGVCGKNMSDGDRSLVAVVITFEDKGGAFSDLAIEQFGVFDPSAKYMLCWECWLKSMGFKPKEKL